MFKLLKTLVLVIVASTGWSDVSDAASFLTCTKATTETETETEIVICGDEELHD